MVLAELAGEDEELVPDRDRFLVPPEPREGECLEAASAQKRLGTVDVARLFTRSARKLGRPLVVPAPSGRVGMQMQDVGQLELSRAGDPELERAVSELQCAIQVAFRTAHREPFAFEGERSGDARLVTELVR